MRASLSRCVIARSMRGPDSREEGAIWESTWPKTQRADTARVLPVALSYVASSLAEPRPRIRECLTPRARSVAPRDLGLLTICTAVRTGAKRGTYFVTTAYGLYSPRTLKKLILGWRRRSNKHAINFVYQ